MAFSANNQKEQLKPGTAAYEEHVRGEIEHYGEIFKEGEGRKTLVQPVPASWHEVEKRASALIRADTGDDLNGHVVKRLNRRKGASMLSLGSGPGGVEISFAQQTPLANIVCIDINPELLDLGRQRAGELGIAVRFEQADLNTLALPPNEYDLVFCHASLHHVIELERVAREIERSLRPNGELIVVDVVTRNGYLMWPETREIVNAIWKTLPERFRINHTCYGSPKVDSEIVDVDQSEHGMECIRSQDILPVLETTFDVVSYVPYFSIARRFFDTMYGPNFDLSAPLDMALFNWVWELDRYLLISGKLRPETFFGIFTKDTVGKRDKRLPGESRNFNDTKVRPSLQEAKANGLILAYPNPVQASGNSGFAATTLMWSSAGTEEVEVRIGSPDGALFASSGPSGTKTTGKWITDKTVFFLQNVTGGLPRTSENTLAVTEVKLKS